jgi:hypothetical protein
MKLITIIITLLLLFVINHKFYEGFNVIHNTRNYKKKRPYHGNYGRINNYPVYNNPYRYSNYNYPYFNYLPYYYDTYNYLYNVPTNCIKNLFGEIICYPFNQLYYNI